VDFVHFKSKKGENVMNKKDLVAIVAEEMGITKKESKIVVSAVIEAVGKGIAEEGRVAISGFGTFKTVDRAARKARNPRTGEEIDVPAKTVPRFKASKLLTEAINEG